MALKKDDVKNDAKADVTTEEDKARADASAKREQKARKELPEGVKSYVNVGEETLTLEVGGTRYEFRKGEPVHLPPGQALDHPDIEEVK